MTKTPRCLAEVDLSTLNPGDRTIIERFAHRLNIDAARKANGPSFALDALSQALDLADLADDDKLACAGCAAGCEHCSLVTK